jgi:hypothetical protein
MFKYFAQFDQAGLVVAVIQSTLKPDASNIIECEGDEVIGMRWDGESFLEVPREPAYKIFDKPLFIYALGVDVFNAINSTNDDTLKFYKYILDNAPYVNMNIPEFRAMVEYLHEVELIDADKLALFLVQE